MELRYKDQPVSNTGGGSSDGSGEIYSTEEQVIGTWIDGKPLYRLTIAQPAFANVDLGSSGSLYLLELTDVTNTYKIDCFTNAYGCFECKVGNYTYRHLVPGSYSSKQFYVTCATSCLLYTASYTGAQNIRYWITLEYTKTTD